LFNLTSYSQLHDNVRVEELSLKYGGWMVIMLLKFGLILKPLINLMNALIIYRYTLGGFFLANYEDSPVGAFDEVLFIYIFTFNFLFPTILL
jgi:hypothetical protein